MASVIQSLIGRYQPELEKLEHWENASELKRAEAARLEKLGDGLLTLIALTICSEETASAILPNQLKAILDRLIDSKCQERHLKAKMLRRILGRFVVDVLTRHPDLSGLREEFEVDFEEESLENTEGSTQNSMLEVEDEDEEIAADFQNFLKSMEKSEANESQMRKREVSTETWGEDTHSMRVLAYLRKMSAPQTELTYLCQEMGWRLSFVDRASVEGRFEVTAEVGFEFRQVRLVLQEGSVAKNKKQGRTFSSAKMLKKIYLSYPEIWDLYEGKRTKKSLVVEKTAYDPDLPPDILDEPVQPIPNKPNADELANQKLAYLRDIANFKSEFNLLNQQNAGVFDLKFTKMQVDGPGSRWKVKGELQVTFKGRHQELTKVDEHLKSKTAEENVARWLVEQVYDAYPDILQAMIFIKAKKGIKT